MNFKDQKQFKFNFKFILNIINKNQNIIEENLFLKFKKISSISKMSISEVIHLTNEISTIKEVLFDNEAKNFEIINLCDNIIKTLEETIGDKMEEKNKKYDVNIEFLIKKANQIENNICKFEVIDKLKSYNKQQVNMSQIINLVNEISTIKEVLFGEYEKSISKQVCEDIIVYLEELVSKTIFD